MELRWYIQEIEKESISSWVSNGTQKYTERHAPILQYSWDGVEWNNVPEVVIKTN